jgi:hypothetical protein
MKDRYVIRDVQTGQFYAYRNTYSEACDAFFHILDTRYKNQNDSYLQLVERTTGSAVPPPTMEDTP